MVKKNVLFISLVIVLFFWNSTEANNQKVEICTWKDDHRSALSISIDDTCVSCVFALARNKFKGTYFVVTPDSRRRRILGYPDMSILYRLGHEIGSHTVSHIYEPVGEERMVRELQTNIKRINTKIGVPVEGIISLSWPGGYVQHQRIAAEYFLCARGYNINQLEDATPSDFMNLKSFNSHEHEPFPPKDFKTILDQAENTGKWAILVFHGNCIDNGAIYYARNKDLWVAPIGTIVKYILQRNRIKVSNFTETSFLIRFTVSRSRIPPSRVRSFESAFNSNDELTFKIDIDDSRLISKVTTDGKSISYRIRSEDNNKYLLLNMDICANINKTIEIWYR